MSKFFHKCIIITAPSGAGKTSITHYLMKTFPQLAFSVSATTREPRVNENNAEDYYFISVEDFKEKIQRKEFIEWEMVYEGKYYGTLKQELERLWAMDRLPVLDIDVQGAIHVQQQYPSNTISIFIQPPSINELKKRLEARGSETAMSLESRINKAAYELSFHHYFENVIVNNSFENACADAKKIVQTFIDI